MPQHGHAIRPSRDADLPRIAAIYAHAVLTNEATFEIEPPTVEEMQRRRADVLLRGLPYLVAECDGEVAGYAYATPYRPRPAYRFTVEDSIYLDPRWQGRGIGHALLEVLIEECLRAGARQMIAVIGGGLGNEASVRVHARCGFVEAGLLRNVGYKFDRWLDTLLMQRAL